MRRLSLLVAAALSLAAPTAAQADWYESSSENFVVYADDSEKNIRTFSEQLERFHRAMEIVTGFDAEAPSASNRVTVFMVKNVRRVQRLAGDDASRNIAGFYIPRAGGSVAYVPRVDAGTGQIDFGMLVLLHEYAHHFLVSNNPFPMPRWLSEGAAEFFASAEFTRDGAVKIGMPAMHRAGELFLAPDVSTSELLDPESYSPRQGSLDAYYGKSWLLYHYLAFEPERRGQLREYMAGMRAGKSSREAAEQAFGALQTLESELDRYLRARSMSSLLLRPDALGEPAIAMRRLTAGEEAIMPVRLRSRRGVTREQAVELLKDARAIAARFPDDAAVLAALAEAEYDAGNDAEAIAAADASLARDPGQENAYVQKGYALFRRAAEAEDRDAAYREAVKPFVALNRLENDHPLPLIYFFRSFVDRDAPPSDLAVQGLERAAELAPFDLVLRLNLARQQALEGRLEAARGNLMPAAYNPHGGAFAEHARGLMERLDSGPLTAEEVASLFSRPPDGEEAEELDRRRP